MMPCTSAACLAKPDHTKESKMSPEYNLFEGLIMSGAFLVFSSIFQAIIG